MGLCTLFRRLIPAASAARSPADGRGGADRIRIVDPATAIGWLREGSATIIDVREAHEHQAGHIPGALLNPLSRFDPAAVPVEPGRHLVFHCQAGKRCGPAAERMMAAGFAGTVHRLNGGMAGWVAAGGPVER